MFEELSHIQLQQYWWFLMSLIGSGLVFLLFVQGGQTLIDVLGKTQTEKTMIITSLGRKWKFTFTTLVTFAAGMFASFPLFYATSFGGAYYAWKIFLLCFVIQSVAYEWRKKTGNILGSRTYEYFLYINGFLGTFLLGAVIATFFTGSLFERSIYNLSSWQTAFYGVEILFNPTNIALGIAVLFLSRTLGALYIINNVDHEVIRQRARKQAGFSAVVFLIFFLYFMGTIFSFEGYAVHPQTKEVFMEANKYLNNYLQMPVALFLFLGGVGAVLYGIGITWFKKSTKGIWFAGAGTFATILSIFFVLGYNNTAFYPSSADMQSSLTIENASASHYTLTFMSYISLLVPFILAYIFIAWRSIDRYKITEAEYREGSDIHKY
ncbi:MAG: cytochrome d ubiquinol oxidase subunit II [Bacteroidales bacterium]